MTSQFKYWLVFTILTLSLAIPALAHKDMKRIKMGVIHPVKCDHEGKHSVKHTIKCGKASGFYIQSPARRYDIRRQDDGKVNAFLTTQKSTNVYAILHLSSRSGGNELWKVTELNAR